MLCSEGYSVWSSLRYREGSARYLSEDIVGGRDASAEMVVVGSFGLGLGGQLRSASLPPLPSLWRLCLHPVPVQAAIIVSSVFAVPKIVFGPVPFEAPRVSVRRVREGIVGGEGLRRQLW